MPHKIKVLIGFFLSLTLCSRAQDTLQYVSTSVDITIYTINFSSSQHKLTEFIQNNGIKIQHQTETKTHTNISFLVSDQQYKVCESLFQELGYTTSKKLNTENNTVKISELQFELSFLNKLKASHLALLQKLDEKSEKYLSFWSELEGYEKKIFDIEHTLLVYTKKEYRYKIQIDLYEEITNPSGNKISFVNMPGVEYSFLITESPLKTVSAKSYQGYFIKYLFTRGKSFASLGAYKSTQTNQEDSTQFSELFMLGFGQDFYSRYLGRGNRKFFNLYSGYTVGFIFATSRTTKANIGYLSPAFGIELFKNKYILWDSKVSYFIPLSYNQNLRGVNLSTSFNFVF